MLRQTHKLMSDLGRIRDDTWVTPGQNSHPYINR